MLKVDVMLSELTMSLAQQEQMWNSVETLLEFIFPSGLLTYNMSSVLGFCLSVARKSPLNKGVHLQVRVGVLMLSFPLLLLGCVCACVHACMFVCVCVSTHVCTCVCVLCASQWWVCVRACMRVCVCVCMCLHMSICLQKFSHWFHLADQIIIGWNPLDT